MCGFAGLWGLAGPFGRDEYRAAIRSMTRSLAHRGPDDEGYFEHVDAGLYLGHRRLSVVDLSKEGHQPMTSPSGRYVVVFNGEVFNHQRLRPELEGAGFRFRGHSDTEVLLAAIEHWGLAGALERFIGMFAIALWDRETRALTLVRDRLGIKPLYYGWVAGQLAFGSELKALRRVAGFDNRVDTRALALFLRHNYIPEPWSIYEGIGKLAPGTWLRIDSDAIRRKLTLAELSSRTSVYWSAQDVVEQGCGVHAAIDAGEATQQLEMLLRDAISLRMEADVPLGAFLSGGVDSSTVVALMQAQSRRPIKTFSIGFRETSFDEAVHARAVARHLRTDHTELYVTPRESMDVIPRLQQMFDEPFSDSSQIPTYLVAQLARRHVTVSLSGDGGDELFGGYERYFIAARLRKQLAGIPMALRHGVARGLRAMPAAGAAVVQLLGQLLPHRWRVRNPRDKVERMIDLLNADSLTELYKVIVSHWSQPGQLLRGACEPLTALSDPARQPGGRSETERQMYVDLVTYLPGDILTKIDRASMAVGLEARVPILDHRVVEAAWQLPLSLKIHPQGSKWILRQILYKYVPRTLVERPKQGFGVPIGAWLRGPLREWAEALLDERQLRAHGFLAAAPIRRIWANHLSGKVNEEYRLWDVLMLQAWFEHERTLASTAPLQTSYTVRTAADGSPSWKSAVS